MFRMHLLKDGYAMAGLALLAIIVSVVFPASTNAAQFYTNISLSYYNRIFSDNEVYKTNNFQRYHTLAMGYQTANNDINFNFNLYEAISGPLADHTITPYTVEAKSSLSNNLLLKVAILELVDVYNKNTPSLGRVVDVRLRKAKLFSYHSITCDIGYIAWLSQKDHWQIHNDISLDIAIPLKAGSLQLLYNGLDTKDRLLLADNIDTLSLLYRWPTWGRNEMSIGANVLLEKPAEGKEQFYLDFRVYFDHLFGKTMMSAGDRAR